MSKKTAKILAGVFLTIAATALVVLLVTLFHKDAPAEPKVTPTPTVTPTIAVPEGSVLLWRLSEVSEESDKGSRYCSYRYEYDEQGRCISSAEYYADETEPHTKCEFSYDSDTRYTTVTLFERGNRGENPMASLYVPDTKTIYVFDTRGNKLSEERYDLEDGAYVFYYRYEYDYDNDGFVTRSRRYDLAENGSFFLMRDSTYDWLGNILTDYDAGLGSEITWSRETYFRDDYGHIIEKWSELPTGDGGVDKSMFGESRTDSLGRVVSRTEPAYFSDDTYDYWRYEYQYFDDGGWRDVSYDLNGYMRELTEYDAYGNKTKEEYWFQDGLSRSTEREYEPRRGGNMLKYTSRDDDESEACYRYEYDEFGNQILIEALVDGEWEMVSTEKYNAEGKIVSKERELFSVEYIFDENGNCVESVHTVHSDGTKESEYYTYVPIVVTAEEAQFAETFYQPVRWTWPAGLWSYNTKMHY